MGFGRRKKRGWGLRACVHACVRNQHGAHSCYVRVRIAKAEQGRARGERGRHEETERRTGGSWACSWWRFNAIVEVDERVEFLERERLRCLIVNEYTFPFLRRLLVALEYYHFIVLYKCRIPVSVME